jgi:hypothetical protein
MNKITKFTVAVGFLLGCGDYSDGTIPNELNTLSTAYSAKRTSNYQLGVTDTHSRMQCDRINSSQSCSLLRNIGLNPRNVSYYIDQPAFGAPGTPINDEIYKAVEEIDTALNGWNFNEVFDLDPWPTILINALPCSGSSTSASISAFSCVNLTETGENLTESTGVVGHYTTHDSAIVHLDMADIFARGAGSLQELYLTRHAAGHGVIAAIGLGGRLDAAAADFFSRMAVDPTWSVSALSVGEKCRLESLNGVGNGSFAISPTVCSGAD